MRRTLLSLSSLLVLLACDRQPPPPPAVDDTPPDGSAHYLDADGVGRTLLTPIETLAYGERVERMLPQPTALSGFEFAGSAGDRPEIILDVQGGPQVSLALYGRRDDTGLWGRPLAAVGGLDVLRISGVELPGDGHYFILVRLLAGPPEAYALALDCPDCAEPVCAAVEPCDLYCEQGYAEGDDGCRVCGCLEDAPCEADDDCLTGEICREGACRPAPTCIERCADAPLDPVCDADGQTWPNRCVADCEAAGELQPGRCPEEACGPERPCPDGQACRAGRCVCDCDDALAPVCGASGRTFSNRCQLDCAGDALAYEGPCDGPPLTVPCEGDGQCPQGQVCATGGDGPGVCTVECRPEMGCQRMLCTPLNERFVCLPPCGRDGRCPEALQCLPDRRGFRVCTPCDCPDEAAPVCVDGRIEYGSRCAALCTGAEPGAIADGPCEGAPAELDCRNCPSVWEPVCADGHVRATACDAECGGRPAARVEPYEQCFEVPPERGCALDADCVVSGVEGEVCAAEPVRAAAPAGPEARCFAAFGVCACIEGTCGFRPARREIERCLERARTPH